jgi:hypothetical protein
VIVKSLYEESVEAIGIFVANRAKEVNGLIVDANEALALKHKKILKKQSDLLKREFSNDVQIEMLELRIETLECSIKARDVSISALKFQIESYEAQTPLNEAAQEILDCVIDTQEKMIDYKSAIVDNYQRGAKHKSLATKDKWLPYQTEYDALITAGIKSSVAQNKVGNKIEAAIRESPAQTPFKIRPDRTTLNRQLVQNRK